MNNLSNYILEKLRINKETNIESNSELLSLLENLFTPNDQFKKHSSEIMDFIKKNIDNSSEYILCLWAIHDGTVYDTYLDRYCSDIPEYNDIKNDKLSNFKYVSTDKFIPIRDKYQIHPTDDKIIYRRKGHQITVYLGKEGTFIMESLIFNNAIKLILCKKSIYEKA